VTVLVAPSYNGRSAPAVFNAELERKAHHPQPNRRRQRDAIRTDVFLSRRLFVAPQHFNRLVQCVEQITLIHQQQHNADVLIALHSTETQHGDVDAVRREIGAQALAVTDLDVRVDDAHTAPEGTVHIAQRRVGSVGDVALDFDRRLPPSQCCSPNHR